MKKGDKVVCIMNANYEGLLTVGKEYQVIEGADMEAPEDYLIVVISDQGKPTVVFSKRFRKVPGTFPRFEPVRHRYWKNRKTGATASIYGAAPWTSRETEHDWYLHELGWIIRDNRFNSTLFPSTLPMHATYEQASAYCDEANTPKPNPPLEKTP